MWLYPTVLAHRGAGILAPENTLAAMRCGLAHGFRAVEFDVMLTSDGVPILMHDEYLGRTVAGKGKISDIPAAELMQMDAGSWFGPQFQGERVPAFTEVAAFCKSHGIWMNVEIKPVPGFERETGKVTAEIVNALFETQIQAVTESMSGAGLETLPLLSSFSLVALEAAQQAAPQIPRAWLVDRIPDDWQVRLHTLDAIALHTNHKNLNPTLAREIKAAGYGLFCYTVNDVQRADEIRSWGVDGFCTDRIDLIGPDYPNEVTQES